MEFIDKNSRTFLVENVSKVYKLNFYKQLDLSIYLKVTNE